ncbi:MAG: hypothetical protein CME65_10570 [Halobacteriovoraceae bacterium]|nr:hypothetical protein [Halobacteriovoraceae bacterium]|tara:strand:+ start:8434 stop:10605 length:2172 start_codon:yes stop_codon:yes gene_type:complete
MRFLFIFLISVSSFAQDQRPEYIESEQLYDYQIEALEAERANGARLGLSEETIRETIASRRERFLMQASGLRPRELRYIEAEDNYERYRAEMIRFFRATDPRGSSMSDEQIVQHYISQGNQALTRSYYNLDRELANIMDFHSSYQEESQGSSTEKIEELSSTERRRVPLQNGQYGRHVGSSVRIGQRSVGIYRASLDPSSEYSNNSVLVGFAIDNDGKRAGQGTREYRFITPGNDPLNAGIRITEDAQASGRMSHDLMETSIYLIPRRVASAMRLIESMNAFEVTLPTGEKAYYDADSMQLMNIPESMLHSQAQDVRDDRHSRNFIPLEYRGSGLSIRVDARAGNPEVPRGTPYNSNEQGSQAILTYQGETCRVNKNRLFSADNNENAVFYINMTDQELNDRILGPECGWDISDQLGTSAPQPVLAETEVSVSPEVELEEEIVLEDEVIEDPVVDVVELNTTPEIVERSSPVEVNLSTTVAPNNCEELVATYFDQPDKKEQIDEYLKIQGKITLHRIALVGLTAHNGESDITQTLDQLIASRNSELHQEFTSSAREMTRNQRLLMIMGELHQVSQTQELDDKYKLKLEDLFTMEMLVKAEEQHGRSYSRGVMDFPSIIKNSVNPRLGDRKVATVQTIKNMLNQLTSELQRIEEEILPLISSSCAQYLNQPYCIQREHRTPSGVSEIIGSSSPIIHDIFNRVSEDQEDFGEAFKWNSYWLHVAE